MGLIQRGDILARLAKALGVKDKSPSPELGSVVQPVVLVGDARDEPVFGVERPFFCFEGLTGAAGQFAGIQLLNPLGSGIDVIVDFVCLSTIATNFLVNWRLNTVVLANAPTKATQYRDTTVGQPLVQARSESLAAVITGGAEVRLASTNSLIVPVDTRFLPGQALTFCAQTAALYMSVSFFGREIVKPYRTT